MTSLTALLSSRLEQSIGRLVSNNSQLALRHGQLVTELAARIEHVEESKERREREGIEQLKARIVALVKQARFSELTSREARTAARMLSTLEPVEVARLLKNRPEVWPRFVDEVFRNWDQLGLMPTREDFMHLLTKTRDERPFLRSVVPLETLTRRDGPQAFATRTLRSSLRKTAEHLKEMGLNLRWAFTAHVLAHATHSFLAHLGFDETWTQLREFPELAAAVLPALESPKGRWFFDHVTRRRKGSTAAQAMFVALLLRELQKKAGLHEAIVPPLMASEFGDPRLPPETLGWALVRQTDREAYNAFLEQFVREDLRLFFEHAMREPERAKFWLRYLKVIRRTICVMGSGNYRQLRELLRHAKPEVQSALDRARRFSAHKGVSAFCLYFDTCVVVEFSDTGNAAYVYPRQVFDAQIEPHLIASRLRSHDDLKLPDLRSARIRHHRGWQGEADDLLMQLGVRRA